MKTIDIMKKKIRIIGKVFIWIIYLLITSKDRQKYTHSKYSGRQVLDVKNDMMGSTFSMGRVLNVNEEPDRTFLNWSEFRKIHNF